MDVGRHQTRAYKPKQDPVPRSPAKESYATDDAVRIGRLHVDVEGWEEATEVDNEVVLSGV